MKKPEFTDVFVWVVWGLIVATFILFIYVIYSDSYIEPIQLSQDHGDKICNALIFLVDQEANVQVASSEDGALRCKDAVPPSVTFEGVGE